MVNLAHLQQQIKSSDLSRARLNPAHPQFINDAYKQLKALGWTCHNSEIHPTDRVPVFRLGPSTGSGQAASIRRDKGTPGAWIVEAGGQVYQMGGDLEGITAEIERLAEPCPELVEGPLPAPLSPAQLEAEGLKAEYPELAERITRALALVEAGQTEFPHYNTRFDPAGFYGIRDCDCGDAVHRQPRAKFGIACKHALAQEIAARMKRSATRVAQQKLADNLAHARARNDYASPAAYRPAADPLNVKAQRPMYQFGKHVVR